MKLTEYLQMHNANFTRSQHRPSFSSQKMAAEEHIPGMMIAKPVMVNADGRNYMCVLPACRKIDLDTLAMQLGVEEVRLLEEKEMAKIFTDCSLGSEPPFGNLYGIPTLMDSSLNTDEDIMFQAGSHEEAITMKLHDYKSLTHPNILDFSYHMS